MAGMPYPPTSVNICAIRGSPFSARSSVSSVLICGRLFSARSFRAFCAHLWEALLCQKFLCVPCVLWEYLFSHGFHRFTQMLRVRFVPTEFTESTEFGSVGMAGMPYPPTSVNIRVICGRLFSARSFCAFRAFCGNIFSPTEFTEFTEFVSVCIAGMPYPPTSVRICAICGSLFSARSFRAFRAFCGNLFPPTEFTESTEFGNVGMAGMPYPPTSVRICGRLFSARSFCAFRAFCGNIFSPTDFTDLHRYLGCAVLPRNAQNTQNLAAWVWQGCHTLLHLCSSVPSVGVLSLQEVLCIRCIPWELLHRLFGWCSRDCCTPWRNPQKLVCTS